MPVHVAVHVAKLNYSFKKYTYVQHGRLSLPLDNRPMDNRPYRWTIVHTGITVKTNYINGKDTFMNFLFLLWVTTLFHVPHKKKNTKSSK